MREKCLFSSLIWRFFDFSFECGKVCRIQIEIPEKCFFPVKLPHYEKLSWKITFATHMFYTAATTCHFLLVTREKSPTFRTGCIKYSFRILKNFSISLTKYPVKKHRQYKKIFHRFSIVICEWFNGRYLVDELLTVYWLSGKS